MATKSKKTTKPRTARKTVKGSIGIKKNNTNWTFIIILLVLVTAVGGFFAYKSKISALAETTYGVTSANVTRNGGSVVNNTWKGGPGNYIKFSASVTSANLGAKEYCAYVVAGTYPGGGSSVSAAAGIYTSGSGEISTRLASLEKRYMGGSNYRYCALINSKAQVGDRVDLYICGKSTETDTRKNFCDPSSKVIGNVTVEKFVRPAF